MAGIIKIGCTLPHGIVLELDNKFVTIAGANQNTSEYFKILGEYGLTDVDSDYWNEWKKRNWAFDPLVAGALFEAGKDDKSAKDKAKEQAQLDTGYAPLNPASHGVEEDKGE